MHEGREGRGKEEGINGEGKERIESAYFTLLREDSNSGNFQKQRNVSPRIGLYGFLAMDP